MKNKVYMIGNAHIDPAWLWRWQQGYAEIKATFQSALDRMDEFDDFVFTCAGAAYYQWIEANAPEMFEKIRLRVKEGRWKIVGGWWLQPDCNIPSGEAFARHGLYSQRYYQDTFGVTAHTGYNVDSFGHNAMLPQLLKLSGMDNYVFMRPMEDEKNLPNNLFNWQSKDGSQVLTYRIPISYTTRDFYEERKTQGRIEELKDISEADQLDQMCFYGVGNHGGGPTIKQIQSIHDMQREYGEDHLLLGCPDEYFKDQKRKGIIEQIPIVCEDLQHHASGCYSARADIKQLNRQSEVQAITAEKTAALSHILTGQAYPKDEIARSWEGIMFNQFHDILGGCSIEPVYEDAIHLYGESMSLSSRIHNAAIQRVSWSIDTIQGRKLPRVKDKNVYLWEYKDYGVPVVVFNPHAWDVVAPIKLNYNIKSIQDNDGKGIVTQTVRADSANGVKKQHTLFVADIPAMGYKVYNLYLDRNPYQFAYKKQELFTSDRPGVSHQDYKITMENAYIRLQFNEDDGSIQSLYDKVNRREVISSDGAKALVIDGDDIDTWGHAVFEFRKELGNFKDAKFTIVEEGPLRVIVRVESRYGQSTLRQDFILYAHDPHVEVKVKVNWQEKNKMLKLSFPANVKDCKAVYDIAYGFIEKPANGQEEPGQQWVDVYGEENGEVYGLSVINDCKYSFDVKDNDLRMTVLRSPAHAVQFSPMDEFMEYMDMGIHTFSYKIVPHKGMWQDVHVEKLAEEFNCKPFAIIETYHEGPLPLEVRGIHVDAENIIASVFKRAEDDDGYVLRCYETNGVSTKASIDMPLIGRKWTASFRPCEIKTFKLSDDPMMDVEEIAITEL